MCVGFTIRLKPLKFHFYSHRHSVNNIIMEQCQINSQLPFSKIVGATALWSKRKLDRLAWGKKSIYCTRRTWFRILYELIFKTSDYVLVTSKMCMFDRCSVLATAIYHLHAWNLFYFIFLYLNRYPFHCNETKPTEYLQRKWYWPLW